MKTSHLITCIIATIILCAGLPPACGVRSSSAQAIGSVIATGDHSATNIVTLSSDHSLSFEDFTPREMSIKCGAGFIRINLQNGNVELPKDVPVDAAARQFWAAVSDAFPECRRAIIAGEKPKPLSP